jgi:nicotinamide phosphoribosyltransferase
MCSLTGFFIKTKDGSWDRIGNFEVETFRYLLKTFPTGILSLVSDTWDLWRVVTEYCEILKDEILARDGKLVIRPDSGDPVDIICGDITIAVENGGIETPASKGVVELLWNIFGGTTTSTGYKKLDSHIGAIYGDSINYNRAESIYERLSKKGFATTNIVLGVGSYSLQMVTRDTHGMAQKATYIEIEVNGEVEGINIFKDPITDDGTKKSATGLIKVIKEDDEFILKDKCTWDEVNSDDNELKVIFKDGKFYNETTLTIIREKLNKLITNQVAELV